LLKLIEKLNTMLDKPFESSEVKPVFSFIIPAKNEAKYIENAVSAFLGKNDHTPASELIVIDDHSDDGTFELVDIISEQHINVTVKKNKGSGKVQALNFGYSLSKGDVIKCIDADDVLSFDNFFKNLRNDFEKTVYCHDYYITDEKLSVKGKPKLGTSYFSNTFEMCLRELKSLPRWTWSFPRSIGDKIFPMPENLPFEDVWFSLVIKKSAQKITYIKKPLYYYRQHSNQTYGGVFNFSPEIVKFRSKRMLKIINVLESGEHILSGEIDLETFSTIKMYYNMLASESTTYNELMFNGMPLILKLKAILIKRFSYLAPFVLKHKWIMGNR
jgi:glycosyltransferase involved in cell wall biosynthesis